MIRREKTSISDVTPAFILFFMLEASIVILEAFSIFNIVVLLAGCLVYFIIYCIFKSKGYGTIVYIKKLEGICGIIHAGISALIFSFWLGKSWIEKVIILVCVTIFIIITFAIIDRNYVKLRAWDKTTNARKFLVYLYAGAGITTYILVICDRRSGKDYIVEIGMLLIIFTSIVSMSNFSKARRLEHIDDK